MEMTTTRGFRVGGHAGSPVSLNLAAYTASVKIEVLPEQGLFTLIALGVGAVISGDFFAWNFGLDRGGYGGLLIAISLVSFCYICISLSLAEMSSMYPSAEGAFKFSKEAFGSYTGFLCGIAATLEYLLLVPVLLTGLGHHLNSLFGIKDDNIQIVWWGLLCVMYLIFHLSGPLSTFRTNVMFTLLSLFTLVSYWCLCVSIVVTAQDNDTDSLKDRIFNVGSSDVAHEFLPHGAYGVFRCLVFATWFFIAVEELPLAAEDAASPNINIPKALIASIVTLTISAFMTSFLAVSVPGGSYNISNTSTPIARSITSGLMETCVAYNRVENGESVCDSFRNCHWDDDENVCLDKQGSYTVNAHIWRILFDIGTLVALFTSCNAIIFAGGRQLMSLTRNGTLPSFTMFDQVTHGTPRMALIFDVVLAFLLALVTFLTDQQVDLLVGGAVAAASLSYVFSMLAFVKLRLDSELKRIARPYKSPLGVAGALYASLMSCLICISFFVDVAEELGYIGMGVIAAGFALVFGASSTDFLMGCCAKSGRERFEEYEMGNNVEDNVICLTGNESGGTSRSRKQTRKYQVIDDTETVE